MESEPVEPAVTIKREHEDENDGSYKRPRIEEYDATGQKKENVEASRGIRDYTSWQRSGFQY